MRAFLAVAGLIGAGVLISSPAQGQVDPATWDHCLHGGPDAKTAACTSAIDSHQLALTDVVTALAERAASYFAQKDFSHAESDLKRAIILEDTMGDVEYKLHYNLGATLYRENTLGSARDELDVAAKLNPQDPAIYTLRGIVQQNSDNLEEAVSDFREASKLSPSDTNVQALLRNANAKLKAQSLSDLSCSYPTEDPRWHPCVYDAKKVDDPTQEDLTRDSIERGTPRDDNRCEDVERNLETARELYGEYKNKYPEHLETAQHELDSSLAEEKAWHCKD